MRIIICGAGVVGFSLAEYLHGENHTLSIVEKDRKICNSIQDKLDLMVLCGTCTSPTILEEAGIESADMIIAVTPDDAKNILVCGIARQFKVPQRIARIRSAEFASADFRFNMESLGVTNVIDPEQVVVDAVMRSLESPGTLDTSNFHNDTIMMRSYRVTADMGLVNRSLAEIRELVNPHTLLIVSVVRGENTIIPHGDLVIRERDIIICIIKSETLPTLQKLVNRPALLETKKIIISGDSRTSLHLAQKLEDLVAHVVLVDPDLIHGKKAANLLLKTEVLLGDCTESDLLKELNIEMADYFIGAGAETQNNMMACLMAKTLGIKEVFCISNEPKHDMVLYSIGINHVINPRMHIAREILETIMSGEIMATFSLRNANLEVMRLHAEAGSKVTSGRLMDIWSKFHAEAIIGAIIHEDNMVIPRGETRICAGDQVIILFKIGGRDKISPLFKQPEGLVEKVKNLLPKG